MAVPAMWAARKDRVVTTTPLLVRVDAHTDFAEEEIDYGAAQDRIQHIEDCLLFANALDADDGGWVESVVKFGWVQDVICLYVHPSEWRIWDEPITDIDGAKHSIYVFPDLANTPPDLGCGPVRVNTDILHKLIELLFGPAQNCPSIWLDIDLDFAVSDVRNCENRAPSSNELRQNLSRPVSCDRLRERIPARDVLSQLINRACLVTIASEPEFAGGFAGVAQVLQGLRESLPEHARVFKWYERA